MNDQAVFLSNITNELVRLPLLQVRESQLKVITVHLLGLLCHPSLLVVVSSSDHSVTFLFTFFTADTNQ